MAACSSTIEPNTPRRSRRRVSAEKKVSTAFSHEPEVGVKWKVQVGRGVAEPDAARPGPSLRSVGNGLKLRPESRALRRAPWRRVPTGAPASVGMGYRLLFVYASRSKAFSVRPAIKPSFRATRKWDQSTIR